MVDKATIEAVLKGLGIEQASINAAIPALLNKSVPSLSPALINMKNARAYIGGVSRWTIMRAVDAGTLRCVRIGRRVMFAPEDLSAFAKRQRVRECRIMTRGGEP